MSSISIGLFIHIYILYKKTKVGNIKQKRELFEVKLKSIILYILLNNVYNIILYQKYLQVVSLVGMYLIKV